jgi:hypothetical protein
MVITQCQLGGGFLIGFCELGGEEDVQERGEVNPASSFVLSAIDHLRHSHFCAEV